MTERNNIFLTENRRDVLHGTSEWSDESISNERSRIKNRARLALKELIEVAASPEIDNSDVFEPDDVYTLASTLIGGTGGLQYESEEEQKTLENADDNRVIAWEPDLEYANELQARLATLILEAEYGD